MDLDSRGTEPGALVYLGRGALCYRPESLQVFQGGVKKKKSSFLSLHFKTCRLWIGAAVTNFQVVKHGW